MEVVLMHLQRDKKSGILSYRRRFPTDLIPHIPSRSPTGRGRTELKVSLGAKDKMHPSLAVHVGDWLKGEIVEPAGVSVTDLAAHFGVSRQALSTLLNGNANLSADMAIRFEKAFEVKADTLLRMQTAYDLARARAHEGDIKVSKFAEAA